VDGNLGWPPVWHTPSKKCLDTVTNDPSFDYDLGEEFVLEIGKKSGVESGAEQKIEVRQAFLDRIHIPRAKRSNPQTRVDLARSSRYSPTCGLSTQTSQTQRHGLRIRST
jgi:hypothetical protein